MALTPGTDHRTTYLSFSAPVALPGVGLAPGTYVFELADPSNDPSLVRVLSRDRSTVYLTAFTEMVVRPAGLRPVTFVALGEALVGRPVRITVWYPPNTGSGRRFIYSQRARRMEEPGRATTTNSLFASVGLQ